MDNHIVFMQRCLQLAKLGESFVAPNPMVGAVLVYNNKIIGEGYHKEFGGAHAEVNCINSVTKENESFISKATLYVSLEPCAHFGKTPPCVDLIIKHKIPKVVIAIQDNFAAVNGNGIKRLKENDIEVITGILEKEAQALLKHFIYFHKNNMPYITLKFAQSADGYLGINNEETKISNALSKRYVHQLRAKHQGILVGKKTVQIDNPELTVRYYTGKNPVRIVLGNKTNIPSDYHIFNVKSETIFIDSEEKNSIQNILKQLYNNQIISILVEGGSDVLQQFIASNFWNEAHVITNKNLHLNFTNNKNELIKAPNIQGETIETINLEDNYVTILKNKL